LLLLLLLSTITTTATAASVTAQKDDTSSSSSSSSFSVLPTTPNNYLRGAGMNVESESISTISSISSSKNTAKDTQTLPDNEREDGRKRRLGPTGEFGLIVGNNAPYVKMSLLKDIGML
jgi:hypothetical protein